MGSSKIIMLSGVYLILGFYTVSFYQADRTNSVSVEAVANSVQAEQLARTGISMALADMGSSSTTKSFAAKSVSMTNGTITYSASTTGISSQSKITSTAVFNGRTITMTAIFSYDRGRWRMIRSYATPTAELVS